MLSFFSGVQLLRPYGLLLARLFCPVDYLREEHWRRLPLHPPGYLPMPGIKPGYLLSLLHSQLGSLPLVPPWKAIFIHGIEQKLTREGY